MAGPTQEFWQKRFLSGQTAWDRGQANPQLHAWVADGAIPSGRVCVPGCGSGWEVAVLARHGFEVTALDYAPAAVAQTLALLGRDGLTAKVVEGDVLEWSPEQPFEAVYEQTCLCALHPDHWGEYAARLHAWLKPGGALLALFMQARRDPAEQQVLGPPYHCDINAMRALFPASRWCWPKPPYPVVPHTIGTEWAVRLVRL
jgi:SAM-dependent methyltransferase